MKKVHTFKKACVLILTLLIGAFPVSSVFAQSTGSGSKFSAPAPNYRGMSATVSETHNKVSDKKQTADYTYTINPDANGDLQITTNGLEKAFEDLSLGFGNGAPGDTFKMRLTLVNNSTHIYHYKNDSLTIAPVYREDGLNGIVGFDGQNIARDASSLRGASPAIKALFNNKTPTFEQMMELYDTLGNTSRPSGGTYTGSEALTDYYLDYYNEKNNTNYTKLEDFDQKTINTMINGNYNTIMNTKNTTNMSYEEYADTLLEKYGDYMRLNATMVGTVNNKKDFSAVIYETEPQLVALSYDNFFNNLYSVSLNDSSFVSYGDMMRKNEAYQNHNASLDSIILNPGESTSVSISLKLSVMIANPYALYMTGTYFALDLEQMDKVTTGSIVTQNIDEKLALINESSTYILSREENGTLQYYGNDAIWTTDINAAKQLYTENGSFTITELPYGSYNIQQVSTPNGYKENNDVYTVVLDKETVTLQIMNTKITEDGEQPVLPETPETPETPTTPEIPQPILPFTPQLPQVNLPVIDTPVNPEITPEEVVKDAENKDTNKEVVKDNATPKAKGTQAAWALVNLLCTIVTALFAIIALFMKHRKEEDNDDDKEKAYEDTQDTSMFIRRRWTKIAGILIALVSIIIFIFTEDVRLPMIMIDKYTILMFIILIIQLIVFIIARKWKNDDNKNNESIPS